MMKTKLFATAVALMILGLTGCDKESIDNTTPQSGKQVLMTMQTGAPDTRGGYYPDEADPTKMNFLWAKNGSSMSVVVSGVTGNENCKLTATEAGKKVPFGGYVTAFTGTKNIYAFYPFNETPYNIANSDDPATASIVWTLPNPQIISQAYYCEGIGFPETSRSLCTCLVGAGTATAEGSVIDASVSMKQVMSIIKINVPHPVLVSAVTLSCEEAVFYTQATVKLVDGTITPVPGSAVKELNAQTKDNWVDNVRVFYLSMFPVDLSGKKIQVTVSFNDGKAVTIEKDGIDFKRNMHYQVDVDPTNRKVRPGAFYLKNGTCVDKDVLLTKQQKTDCIGIVFDALASTDVSGKEYKVVSLLEGKSKLWGPQRVDEATIAGASVRREDYGAYCTKDMLSKHRGDDNYSAFNWIFTTVNAQDDLGRWYMPAIKELEMLAKVYTTVNASMEKLQRDDAILLGAEEPYWSCTLPGEFGAEGLICSNPLKRELYSRGTYPRCVRALTVHPWTRGERLPGR